jgi:precorrin-6A/cobalt-precorrin-6A reductase
VILLLGGTSETAPLAQMLAEAGFNVLVSTATSIDLDIGDHRRIRRRTGRLDAAAMSGLIRQEKISAVVDAAHPYAEQLHTAARRACAISGIRRLRFQRAPMAPLEAKSIHWARDYEQAAELACGLGVRVLLTIGSNNITPFIRQAEKNGVVLFARVLPEPDSLDACRSAGLSLENVIAVRGPFTVGDNTALFRSLQIDVLVTKESGAAGGMEEKIRAAGLEKCEAIIVQRPEDISTECYQHFEQIVAALQ